MNKTQKYHTSLKNEVIEKLQKVTSSPQAPKLNDISHNQSSLSRQW